MEKITQTFYLEKQLFSEGYNIVIGIDEAGRGPLAGPVVAGAVAWRKSEIHDHKRYALIRDSKKLSEKQRESIHDLIFENFYVGVGICDHETIDRMNILEATYLAMKKAMSELLRSFEFSDPNTSERQIILVDGNKSIPNMSMEQRAIIGGDNIIKSISAASIVAKVTRDRIMDEWHEKYPQYGFVKHKGYGTKMHIDAIRKYGPCDIHRKSFAPVKKAIDVMNNIF